MNKFLHIILFSSFIFCLDSPSDKYLNSMDVINKIGNQLSSDITIVDDNGKSIKMGQFFNDKPTVLALAYYNCPMLCTMVLNGLSDAINAGGLPSYSDYQGKINYRPNPYSNFTILGILGSSLYERNVKDARSNGEDSYGYVKNDQSTLGLNHRFIWSKNGFSNSSVSITDQTSKNQFFVMIITNTSS